MKLFGLIKMRSNGTCNNVRISKHLSDISYSESERRFVAVGFQFLFKYAVGKVPEKQERFQLNWTRSALMLFQWGER